MPDKDRAITMQLLASEKELESLIGLNALERLERKLGGSSVYLPTEATPSKYQAHETKPAITLAEFRVLTYYYGGLRVRIPKNLIKQKRDEQIRADIKAGSTPAAQAEKHQLTERQIRNICQK